MVYYLGHRFVEADHLAVDFFPQERYTNGHLLNMADCGRDPRPAFYPLDVVAVALPQHQPLEIRRLDEVDRVSESWISHVVP
jgi:hypothetical protein